PIFMCGYTANNLHDIEKDRENHPDRPLPAGEINISAAAIAFFCLLALALISVREWIVAPNAFLYLLILIAMINYNYVVFYFPSLKNVLVAFAGTIPLFILAEAAHGPTVRVSVICSLFFFLLGIEVLSDTEDIAGDGNTLVKMMGTRRAANIAFFAKILADFL